MDHKHHRKLDVTANTLSEKDMSHEELKLTNLLYDVNVHPSTIVKVLTTLKDDDVGTFLHETLFNINEKCQSLIDVANGILPTCSDAEKTLMLLQMYVGAVGNSGVSGIGCSTCSSRSTSRR